MKNGYKNNKKYFILKIIGWKGNCESYGLNPEEEIE